MARDTIKAVLVGCGGISRAWLNAIPNVPRLQLVGLTDLRRQAAEDRARQCKLPPEIVFDDLKSAVKATGADAVFDCTVPEAHHLVTLEALKLGCHVLGEKPMSDTLANARRMVAAARKARRAYAVTQTRRPNPMLLAVARMLRAGVIGQIEEIHSDFYIGARFKGFRAEMAHPLIVDMAIHTFDNARQLADAHAVAVCAHTWNPKHSWYRGDASALCLFDMVDRKRRPIVYTYRGSWCDEGCQTSWNADWRIVGSKGTLRFDGESTVRTQVVKPDSKPGLIAELEDLPEPEPAPGPTGHEAMIRNFVAHLTEREPLWCPCQDNIRSLAMVLAAVKSADSRRRVPVQW